MDTNRAVFLEAVYTNREVMALLSSDQTYSLFNLEQPFSKLISQGLFMEGVYMGLKYFLNTKMLFAFLSVLTPALMA